MVAGAGGAVAAVCKDRARGGAGGKKAAGLVQEQADFAKFKAAMAKKNNDTLAKRIVTKYDQDKSGTIERKELKRLLKKESAEVFGEETIPSEDDVKFIFTLCDNHGGKADGAIDRDEILNVCKAWSEFLENKSVVQEYAKKYDQDGNNMIDQAELQEILEEVNHPKAVPTEVVTWVMQQSDLSKNGSLELMELARALMAFRMWKEGNSGPKDTLVHDIAQDPNLPRSATDSKCCVIC